MSEVSQEAQSSTKGGESADEKLVVDVLENDKKVDGSTGPDLNGTGSHVGKTKEEEKVSDTPLGASESSADVSDETATAETKLDEKKVEKNDEVDDEEEEEDPTPVVLGTWTQVVSVKVELENVTIAEQEEDDSEEEEPIEMPKLGALRLVSKAKSPSSKQKNIADTGVSFSLGGYDLVESLLISVEEEELLEDSLDLMNLMNYAHPKRLLQESQPALILRSQMNDVETVKVMLQVICCLPSQAKLLKNVTTYDVSVRGAIVKKLMYICSELILQSKGKSNACKLIIDNDLLVDMWSIVDIPTPLHNLRAAYFKLIMQKLLKVQRVPTLVWLSTTVLASNQIRGNTPSSISQMATSIRAMPMFRLLKHLENDHIAYFIGLALEREASCAPPMQLGLPQMKTPREKAQVVRWSQKFDFVRVLVHRLSIQPNNGTRRKWEDVSTNSANLLSEVLRNSSTHVDLLKKVMESAKSIFVICLTRDKEGYVDKTVFFNCINVLTVLCASLSRIWMPSRKTKVIHDTLQIYATFFPHLRDVFNQPSRNPKIKLGFIKHRIARLVSVILSGRLVGILGKPFLESGLLKSVIDAVFNNPTASIYHHTILFEGICPMIKNCLGAVIEPLYEAGVEVASGVMGSQGNINLWGKIMECYYSYKDDEGGVSKVIASYNGYLTTIANLICMGSFDIGPVGVKFLADRLSWVNLLQSSPLARGNISPRQDKEKQQRIIPARGASSEEQEEGQEEEEMEIEEEEGETRRIEEETPPQKTNFSGYAFWNIPVVDMELEDL